MRLGCYQRGTRGMQARSADVKDISNRIIACLSDENTQTAGSDEKVYDACLCRRDCVRPSGFVSDQKNAPMRSAMSRESPPSSA